MMAFCNIHCLMKSSRIIVIPTTSVNVLWDAIVPLSPTPTLIGSTICQTSKFIVFRNTSVVFLNINNKQHLSIHPKEYISFGKGVSMSFFLFSCINTVFFSLIELFVLQYCFRHCAFCNLDWGITIYYHFKFKKKIIYDTRLAQGMYNN